MVKLEYGNKIIEVTSETKFLSPSNQKLLLDGKFVLETGVGIEEEDDVRKSYYIGVLYEIFARNFEEFSFEEIYVMMKNAYPIFVKKRQVQNILNKYYELKTTRDVFASVR